jgi:REP element-mobilizing transposase RayT
MNGKQSKRSRALKRELNKHAEQKAKELAAQKQIDIAEIVGAYNHALFQQSFF